MTDHVDVNFTCPKCGGRKIDIAEPVTPESATSCSACGASFGRWGDINQQAVDLAKTKVVEAFKKGLGPKWKRK